MIMSKEIKKKHKNSKGDMVYEEATNTIHTEEFTIKEIDRQLVALEIQRTRLLEKRETALALK